MVEVINQLSTYVLIVCSVKCFNLLNYLLHV